MQTNRPSLFNSLWFGISGVSLLTAAALALLYAGLPESSLDMQRLAEGDMQQGDELVIGSLTKADAATDTTLRSTLNEAAVSPWCRFLGEDATLEILFISSVEARGSAQPDTTDDMCRQKIISAGFLRVGIVAPEMLTREGLAVKARSILDQRDEIQKLRRSVADASAGSDRVKQVTLLADQLMAEAVAAGSVAERRRKDTVLQSMMTRDLNQRLINAETALVQTSQRVKTYQNETSDEAAGQRWKVSVLSRAYGENLNELKAAEKQVDGIIADLAGLIGELDRLPDQNFQASRAEGKLHLLRLGAERDALRASVKQIEEGLAGLRSG